jgi:hypothetical protein
MSDHTLLLGGAERKHTRVRGLPNGRRTDPNRVRRWRSLNQA